MRFAIMYGKDNIAGKNIAEEFKKLAFAPQFPIIELKKDAIFSDDITLNKYPELKNIDFIIFASTHRSEKNFPSLCIHAPGNWRGADLEVKPGKICKTSAFVLKYLFQKMNEYGKDLVGYNITMEATHHGPYIDIPCCFIEVGSSEKEWNDDLATTVIAKTILSLENYHPNNNWIPSIAIGGPHYCPSFNKIQLSSNHAISHVIQEYAFPLNESMLHEAETKTIEQIKEVLIDWKGCGKSEDRQKILLLLDNLGLKYKRTSEVEK